MLYNVSMTLGLYNVWPCYYSSWLLLDGKTRRMNQAPLIYTYRPSNTNVTGAYLSVQRWEQQKYASVQFLYTTASPSTHYGHWVSGDRKFQIWRSLSHLELCQLVPLQIPKWWFLLGVRANRNRVMCAGLQRQRHEHKLWAGAKMLTFHIIENPNSWKL